MATTRGDMRHIPAALPSQLGTNVGIHADPPLPQNVAVDVLSYEIDDISLQIYDRPY
ncbi:hypothetical protein PAXRUDRAFT_832076 [Paxillus rubicundulus Ve08.2h10]|uniref:Uncharacterized protein n=1 Tax=Paxillus rubicundulus Ve08.2h10 TaxID=930991 RepID=A0A0D0CKR2_9AGAM|nr:hypothetical protein PAXRUDRAFT_832076 [Paxillus rubicundulus Ve08.2h10]